MSHFHLSLPRERLAVIIERELPLYEGVIHFSHPFFRGGGQTCVREHNMAVQIARSQNLKIESVKRRMRGVRFGIVDRNGNVQRGVDVWTVDWILCGLGRVDAWHGELADWTRLLIAFEQQQLTFREYEQQSRIYNVCVQAETAPAASNQRRVAA